MSRVAVCNAADFITRSTMNYVEHATRFLCQDSWLYGIVSFPEDRLERGVLIVVGGPQYRAGSHRQFVLLARYLASQGVPVMRFDYRGMGDSEGDKRNFNEVNEDLNAAANHFFAAVPGMRELVILGLCDAASASLFYAHTDARVSGLILLNPWVRTEQGIARAYLNHYYFSRMFEAELWRKILHGHFNYRAAVKSLLQLSGAALKLPFYRKLIATKQNLSKASLPDRMFDGLSHFSGKVLIILSGKDMTAHEFSDLATKSRKWSSLLKSSAVKSWSIAAADHTFSKRIWRDQLALHVREWLQSW